ncbi:MAG: endonuclease III domain-containing protein [Candidatus Acidiferrales bacterium]
MISRRKRFREGKASVPVPWHVKIPGVTPMTAMPKRAKTSAGSRRTAGQRSRLAKILDRLEKHYGPPKRPYPTDPYEMLLHRNGGYPQSDERCDKGFQALKKQIGLAPKRILAASDEALREAARRGGMVPELRAQRFRDIAARVLDEFQGDMRAVLKRPLADAKKALKKFPTVGDSTAEKILLFTGTAPVAALPSNCLHVPLRLGFGCAPEKAAKNWAAAYRSAQEAVRAELPETCEAQIRAYLLIKRHGAETCKLAHPRCEQCPVADMCPFFLRVPGASLPLHP